jgi:ATP-binding cassette subfamily B protein
MKLQTKFPNAILPFMAHFLAPYKLYVLGFIFCAVISGLYGIVNATLTKVIINSLEETTDLRKLWDVIFWPAVFLVINFEVHNWTWRGIGLMNCKVQPVIKNNVIRQTFAYVYRHSHQFFQDNLAGKISNNITILADNMERALHEIFHHIIRGIVLLGGALATMYFVHPLFFYGLLTWTVCFTIISYFISRRITGLAEAHASSESLVSGQLVDSISNAQNIRLFAQYAYESSYIMKALGVMKQNFRAKELFLIKFHFLQGISLTLMLAFMLYALVTLRMQGLVTVGDYALILGLSIEVGFTLWWVTEQVDHLNSAIGKCTQSLKALFTPLEITDKEGAQPLIVHQGEIVFDKVKFHYKGSEPLFQNKSVTIPAGQKVGLVGYSGGGKTTFANLILRLFDVTSGHILIDGHDIRDVTQDSLRSNIGMIPQDPSLFHRTLMENIRYGRLDASEKEVIDAAKKAHAHEFITKLSQGYGSLVGERGVKLSGGQRQRVAIARAILKNAPILILDEATSQLDSVTENEIQDGLQHLMQGKTTIVIAHRLSTLMHMDRILVFDQGKIVEDGIHQDLLAKKGLYKTLWDAQVGGFLPETA